MKTLGQSGCGMVAMHSRATSNQWQHVLACLPTLAATADDGTVTRSGAATAAAVSAIPDGNHGDNNFSTATGNRS